MKPTNYKEVWSAAYEDAQEMWPTGTEREWTEHADDMLADWHADQIERVLLHEETIMDHGKEE